jgi:large subunit ribosomal protein L4
MATISVYNAQGEEVEKLEVSEAVFGVAANDTLLHQVYVAIMANIRGVYAHTKTRGEVSGTGKKPWKQKGTGRARVGSLRNPAWRKGGIVFGPRNTRNFLQKINQKVRRKAVMIALSGKVRQGKLIVVENLSFSGGKTKLMAQAVREWKLCGKSVLMGFSADEQDFMKTSRNIPRVENILTENVNAADLLNHQYFVLSKTSLLGLEKRFSATTK